MRIMFSHERLVLSVKASSINATYEDSNQKTYELFEFGKIYTLEDANVLINLEPDIIYIQESTEEKIIGKLKEALPRTAIVKIHPEPDSPGRKPGITLSKLKRLYDLKTKESG